MWQPQDVPRQVRDDRIQRAIDFIHSKPDGKLTVHELAERVCMSPKHFERVFKRETGQNPKRYLMAARIETAKPLVAETDQPIGEIAEQVGYSEPKRFRKDFKKHTGSLPSECRKARRSGETA